MNKYFDTRLDKEFRKNASAIWQVIGQDILALSRSKPHTVIDVGAGYGDFINGIAVKTRWAIDQWPDFLKCLNPDVRGLVCDIRSSKTDVPHSYFDLVFLSNVLEHFTLEDASLVLNNISDWLNESGLAVFLQPNFRFCYKNYFDDYTHKTVFTDESLSCFLRDQGFEIVKVVPRYLPFSFKSRLPKPLWAVKAYLKSPIRPLGAQMLVIARKAKSNVEKQ
jgi:2-polyprenyl-3-methyl-5-hydroxy-6-metoxy-1,4-benzoquinol methylase